MTTHGLAALLLGSVSFEQVIAEDAKRILVTHPVASIDTKGVVRDTEVKAKEDTQTNQGTKARNEIDLTR